MLLLQAAADICMAVVELVVKRRQKQLREACLPSRVAGISQPAAEERWRR